MTGATTSLTIIQLADILGVDAETISILAENNQIPFTLNYNQNSNASEPCFNIPVISNWLRQRPNFKKMKIENYLNKIKLMYQTQFPDVLKELKEFEQMVLNPPSRQKKYFYLSKVPNKKYGFLYYVRYYDNGKLIRSRWNTFTNDFSNAQKFALENRERILAEYYKKHSTSDLFYIMETYYQDDSPYLAIDSKRGRTINAKTRSVYRNFITKKWMPFLVKNKITQFSQITPPLIAAFQNSLLDDKNKPQTVNRFIGSIKTIYAHLIMNGTIHENPFSSVTDLTINEEDLYCRNCHEIDKFKGIFKQEWSDRLSYFLCLLIYSTGLRNREIENIQVKDLITLYNYKFIDIPKSKTKNGVRIVPLHPFTYAKLKSYIDENNLHHDDYLFSSSGKPRQSTDYNKANADLGKLLNLTEAELDKEHITFYSGRQFFKTLINSEDLGPIEEYFMGHKVSRDVSKLYNHREKQGRQKFIQKTRELLKILDKRLF
jgi:integrase